MTTLAEIVGWFKEEGMSFDEAKSNLQTLILNEGQKDPDGDLLKRPMNDLLTEAEALFNGPQS